MVRTAGCNRRLPGPAERRQIIAHRHGRCRCLRHRTLSTTQRITGGQAGRPFFVRSQVHPQVVITCDVTFCAFEQLAADELVVANQVLVSAAQSYPAPSDSLETRTAN